MSVPSLPPGFEYVRHLGRGGTADVYLTRSEQLDREVALKLPLPLSERPGDDTPFGLLVQREQTLIGNLRFPGLVRILDASANSPEYVALELCTGRTLDQLGRIDNLALAMNLLSALALNLEFLCAVGLVHGDFKPQNVFLPADESLIGDDRLFWLKLSDFSLGKKADETDEDRIGLGTVGYMAPETIVSGKADHRSDLFALGVTAYQMLTGVHPFIEGESDPVAINSRCREEDPRPVVDYRNDCPNELLHLIDNLLAKSSCDRPSRAWDICVALEEMGAGYPYRNALRPAHLVDPSDYNQAITSSMELNDSQRNRLDVITGASPDKLRLVLSTAFQRDELTYESGKFRFTATPYWPTRCRHEELHRFGQAPLQTRKDIIRSAIRGETGQQTAANSRAILHLLPHLLRPATVRRLSLKPARDAESSENYQLAARLYLQAGLFEEAERCGYQAAQLLHKEHESTEALRVIQSVVDYATLLNRETDTVALLKSAGDILKSIGRVDEAQQTYERIEVLYKARQPDLLLARTFKSLGDLFKMKQKFNDGVESLNKALAIYETLDNELELSHTYNNMGNLYFIAGKRSDALTCYRRALKVQRRLNATAEIASTLSNIGGVLAVGGRFRRAVNILEVSLKLKREIGDMGEIARSLNNLGYIHYVLGEKQQAMDALTESLELNRKIDSKKEILFNLDNLTGVMIAAGRLKEALTYLREGMALSKQIDDKPHRMMLNRSTLTVLRRMGRPGEAQEPLRLAQELLGKVDDAEERVRIKVEEAALRAAVGDYERALEIAAESTALADELNVKPEKLNALLMVTRISDDDAAASQAAQLADDLKMDREKFLVSANRLGVLIENDRMPEAHETAKVVEECLSQYTDDLEYSRIALTLAEYFIAAGKIDKSIPYVQKGLRQAEQSGLVPETITGLLLTSRLQSQSGSYEEAFKASKHALQLCKTIAENISNEDDRRRFQQTRIIQTLVTEIRDLQAKIGQKKGAGC